MNVELLVKALGTESNIKSFTHCMTRLRFNIKDMDNIDFDSIKELDDVLGVQIKGGQLQVIMQGSIEDHYNNVRKQIGGSVEEDEVVEENLDEKTKFSLNGIINTLAAILTPAIPALAGGGLLKAVYLTLTTFGLLDRTSDVAFVLNIISDGMFFYLPFILAVSSAKRFETNTTLAVSLAGILMYPSFMELAGAGGTLTFLGIPILVANYKASVIPIILSVWMLSKVSKIANKVVPKSLNIIFVPFISILVTALISLVALAPIGFYLATYVGIFMETVITLNPFIAGFIVSATRPFLVLTGMHHSLTPITLYQLETYGSTTLSAMALISTFAQASAALAFGIFSKKDKDKQLGLTSAVTGYIGITEPILFGILVPNKVLMGITMFAGGLGGGISAMLGGTSYGYVMPGVLSLAAYMGDGFNGILIGAAVAIVTTLVLYGIYTRRDNK